MRVAASDAVLAPPGPATRLAADVREIMRPWCAPLSGTRWSCTAGGSTPLYAGILTNTSACGPAPEPPIAANRCTIRLSAPLPLPPPESLHKPVVQLTTLLEIESQLALLPTVTSCKVSLLRPLACCTDLPSLFRLPTIWTVEDPRSFCNRRCQPFQPDLAVPSFLQVAKQDAKCCPA